MEMPKQKKILMPRGAIQKKAEWSGTRGSYLTHIPNLSRDTLEEIEVVPIREPFTYSRVVYDHDRSEYVYEVWEPQLNAEEKEFLDMIKDSLNRTLEYEWDKMAEKDKKEYLQEAVDSFIKSRGLRLAPASKDKLVYCIIRDFVGYGPVDVLMADPRIEDVSCDGTGIPLFIFHQKFESIKTNVVFDDDDGLNSFAVMLGQRCAKQISVANPILDGTSVEGHRVQATYSHEVTTRGSSFTIRRYKEKPFTPVELVKFGTASAEMVAYLWVAVENGKSMMVCGGTASGKTATLNSAALFIRPGAKIVSIEDTREINLHHENWIPGTTRSGVGGRGPDGKAGGEIDMYALVRAALRQRPNYIVVGEVRGKETYTMFQAMATGHPTMSTMHADSVKSMVNRLENPPINTPRILLTALNFVIIQSHARIGDSIVRRMKQIVELVGFEPETNELITNTVYEWDAATDTFVYKGHSFLFDEIMEMKNMTHEEMEAEFQRRVDIINYMLQKNLIDFREIAKIVVQYWTGSDPELEDNLLKAHIRLRPEEYLAVAWMNTTFAAVGAVVAAFVAALFLLILSIPIVTLLTIFALVAAIPIFFSYMYAFGLPVGYHGKPAGMAKKRGHKIDKRISGAMSFISAMASADVPVDVIFKELSKQTIYGEVAKEAEWITRDTELLGLDILTAIRKAAQRSPSSKFSDFLQGVVTTSTSGGQLKPYFLVKAEQFEKEDRLEMRKKMETLGMLAESFVTVVVAFPLFLVVIMAIMALISKTGSGFVVLLLYVVVALMIPMSQFGFIFVIWNMEQEG